jgi:tRNA(fMet)-specific endonuclease VapC
VRYLLDTNVCIALLRGGDAALIERTKRQDPSDLFLSSVVKGELLFGARNSGRVDANLSLLGEFFSQFESLPFDDGAAQYYGVTRALLSRAGTPIGANDLLIASTALQHDLTVATRNRRELARVPGLRWEDW